MKAEELLNRQQAYFKSGAAKSIEFRIHQLKTLKKALVEHENELSEAVHKDFGKPVFETYTTELGILHSEISYAIKNLKNWAKPERVSTTLVNFPSINYIIKEPYGSVLIIAPWNYPIQLALLPLVAAIAAGNTAVIKPSELTPHTSRAIASVLGKWFKEEFIAVLEGGADTTRELLAENFDYIFFTGSARVGKMVMEAASKNLTPVTLELGGKSPCIVDESANLKIAARRIAWGKFINAGQTCVAPDYLLIHSKLKIPFLKHMKEAIYSFYGDDAKQSPDYARIINKNHFNRLSAFLDTGKIAIGGQKDEDQFYIEPTVLDEVSVEDEVMKDEIFGPILPVLTFEHISEAIDIVNSYPKPLALYLFTENDSVENKIMEACAFGGGAVNDVVAQLGNHRLPFGGVGNSGLGTYHGKAGFDTFSHKKSIMKKPTWIDIPLRYAPYKNKLKWVKRLLK